MKGKITIYTPIIPAFMTHAGVSLGLQLHFFIYSYLRCCHWKFHLCLPKVNINMCGARNGREEPPGEKHGGSATWIDLRRWAERPRGAV